MQYIPFNIPLSQSWKNMLSLLACLTNSKMAMYIVLEQELQIRMSIKFRMITLISEIDQVFTDW